MMSSECPIERALGVLGRRGALLVVRDLLESCRRFGELQRSTGLPPHTLSRRVKELEVAGLVSRVHYGEIPPRVEYSLTASGEALGPVLDELASWGEQWLATRA